MTRFAKRCSLLILALLLLLTPITSSLYSSRTTNYCITVEWERAYYAQYDVIIDVNTDGSINVTEIMKVVYVFGIFRYAYRDIPYYGYDDIVDIKVYELVGEDLIEYEPGDSAPGTYKVTKSLTSVHIKWWYSEVDALSGKVVKTFVLSYRATCALDVDNIRGINYLHWYALPEEHLYIQESFIKIRLPPNVNTSELVINPTPNSIKRLEDGRVEILYVLMNIHKTATLEVYVAFPKIINVPFSPRKILNRYTFWLILLTIITPALLIGLYAKREKSKYSVREYSLIATGVAPNEIDAAEACVLSKLTMPKTLPIVILFQLAEKGYVRFRKTEKSTFVEILKKKEENIESLKPWEKAIFSRLMQDEIYDLSDLIEDMKWSYDWAKARKEAYSSIVDSLINKGLIPGDPSEIWKPAVKKVLKFALVALGLMFFGYLTLIYGLFITGVSSLFMVILSTYFVKKIAVHRTRSGEFVYQRAKHYARELERRLRNVARSERLNTISREFRDIFTYGFAWLLAIEGLSIFRILEDLWRELSRKYRKERMPYWYPHWFSSTSRSDTETIYSLKLFINSFKPAFTIITRSASAITARGVGGISGGIGGIGGAGGGGSAGVG